MRQKFIVVALCFAIALPLPVWAEPSPNTSATDESCANKIATNLLKHSRVKPLLKETRREVFKDPSRSMLKVRLHAWHYRKLAGIVNEVFREHQVNVDDENTSETEIRNALVMAYERSWDLLAVTGMVPDHPEVKEMMVGAREEALTKKQRVLLSISQKLLFTSYETTRQIISDEFHKRGLDPNHATGKQMREALIAAYKKAWKECSAKSVRIRSTLVAMGVAYPVLFGIRGLLKGNLSPESSSEAFFLLGVLSSSVLISINAGLFETFNSYRRRAGLMLRGLFTDMVRLSEEPLKKKWSILNIMPSFLQHTRMHYSRLHENFNSFIRSGRDNLKLFNKSYDKTDLRSAIDDISEALNLLRENFYDFTEAILQDEDRSILRYSRAVFQTMFRDRSLDEIEGFKNKLFNRAVEGDSQGNNPDVKAAYRVIIDLMFAKAEKASSEGPQARLGMFRSMLHRAREMTAKRHLDQVKFILTELLRDGAEGDAEHYAKYETLLREELDAFKQTSGKRTQAYHEFLELLLHTVDLVHLPGEDDPSDVEAAGDSDIITDT